MIHGKYRDTGITQCFKFWFDGAIAENTITASTLRDSKISWLLACTLIIAAAIDANDFAPSFSTSSVAPLKASRSQKC